MRSINFPSFQFKITGEGDQQKIFDVVRRKHIVLTPEEWVRQHMIHYLIDYKGYPKGLMAVEKAIQVDDLIRRPDIVVYNRSLVPILMVELKSMEIEMTQDIILQVAMYNKKLKVPHILLSNGLKHLCAKVDYVQNRLDFLEDIPDYSTISK